MISLGYCRSQAYHSLYIKSSKDNFNALLVYVGDIVLGGSSMQENKHVKQLLDQKCKIKDLGDLRFFLGFEIARSNTSIFTNKRKHTLELLEDTKFLATKPSSVPFDPTFKLSNTYGQTLKANWQVDLLD